MNFYWELIQHDGTRVEIPPEGVEVVKRRWDNGQPIHTSDGSIPANQIKTFRQTSKQYGMPLLEAASHAFDEPMINEDGSVKARWVKKQVTQSEYNKKYSAIPSYRSLGNDGGMVVVAFRLPVNSIDSRLVEYCNNDDINVLT